MTALMHKNTVIRVSLRYLLRTILSRNAVFERFFAFLHSKNFIFACCLGGLHQPIALNLPKYSIIHTVRMSFLSKICPDHVFAGHKVKRDKGDAFQIRNYREPN